MLACTISDSNPMEKEGCIATSIQEIRACLNSGQNAILNQDIFVNGNDCDGPAVLDLSNLSNVSIIGCGNTIKRTSGQEDCSLVFGNQNTKNIAFDGVTFCETPGPDVPPLDTFPRMLHFVNSCDICFVNSTVEHSWDYAIYANGVDGFKFKNSAMNNAGALGLYLGNPNNPSTDFEICNSSFDCNTTNALALLGANNGCVENNTFTDNHKLGIFATVPPFPAGFTGGGQVYIAEVNNVKFNNNCIQDGFCSNCVTSGMLANPVTGLEIGRPNQASVFGFTANNNKIVNNTGYGIRLNTGSVLDGTTLICDTSLVTGNGVNLAIPAANTKP